MLGPPARNTQISQISHGSAGAVTRPNRHLA